MGSAIEREYRYCIAAIRDGVNNHDRGVIIGLIFCCIPFVPVTLFGLLLTLWNWKLYKERKLQISEIKLIQFSLFAGLISLILGLILAVVGYNIARDMGVIVPDSIGILLEYIANIIRNIAGFIGEIIRTIWGDGDNTMGAEYL